MKLFKSEKGALMIMSLLGILIASIGIFVYNSKSTINRSAINSMEKYNYNDYNYNNYNWNYNSSDYNWNYNDYDDYNWNSNTNYSSSTNILDY
ncbi:MAG: hypothetical protein IKG42_05470 [Clostridia bacterium]|nr:hypothetical protein [Clostridia bacterium]